MIFPFVFKQLVSKVDVSITKRLYHTYFPSARMTSFVEKQLHLLEIEHLAEIEEKNFEAANLPLKVLQRKGACITKLVINSLQTGLYDRSIATFSLRTIKKTFPFNIFSPGDIVKLNNPDEQESNSEDFNGVVTKISDENISVAFDSLSYRDTLDQLNQYGKSVALIKVANKATYERLKQAMKDLSKCSGGPSQFLVEVLFGDAAPSASNIVDVDFFNKNLNTCQCEAVQFALKQRELAIIHGPPGTGKTTTVIEIIAQLVKSGLKVLACAPSNVAVDNMLEKLSQLRLPTARHSKDATYLRKLKLVRLGHPARILDPTLQELSLDALIHHSGAAHLIRDVRSDLERIQVKMRKSSDANRRALYQERRNLTNELRKREKKAIRDILQPADVVLATNVGAYPRGPLHNLPHDHFDVVVIDECGQALEASCWVPILRARKCILAGDHLQLSPTIVSSDAASEGLSLTLLERMIKLHGDKVVRMLTEQYRMHQDIMKWPSQKMYDDKLTAHDSVEQHLLTGLPGVVETEETRLPLLLIDTAGCDMPEAESEESDSKANEGEVKIVCRHLSSLILAGVKPEDIAVISPYNLQVDILRNIFHDKYPRLEIKSVDGFQGREKEAVILSLVRSNNDREVGFLSDHRRLNVAVTRARRHITIICDSDTVSHDAFIKSLLDYMSEHGEVRTGYEYLYDGNDDLEDDHFQSVLHSFHLITPSPKLENIKSSHKKSNVATSKSNKTENISQKSKKKSNVKAEVDIVNDELKVTYRQILIKYKRMFIDSVDDSSCIVSDKDEPDMSQALDIEVNEEKKKIDFPSTLTSAERKVVHEICEEFSLTHQSSGKGKNRKITVFFRTADVLKSDNGEENNDSIESISNDINEKFQSDVCVSDNADMIIVNVSDDKDTFNNIKSDVSNVENRYNKLEDCVQDAVESPPSDSNLPPPGFLICDKCGKSLPENNMNMHSMHCERMMKLKSRLEPSTINSNNQPSSSSSKKNTRKSNSKNSKKTTFTGTDDEVLNKAITSSRTCCYTRCKASVATIGQLCTTCRRTFCTSHSLPEVHGCGDKARASARRQIIRDGVIYPGSGVPNRKPPPDKRAIMKHRLESKLKSKEDSRKGNKTKK